MRQVNASVHVKTIMARVMASALMMTVASCVHWSWSVVLMIGMGLQISLVISVNHVSPLLLSPCHAHCPQGCQNCASEFCVCSVPGDNEDFVVCNTEVSTDFVGCLSVCAPANTTCSIDCNRHYNEQVNECPCWLNCPGGCPCPVYQCPSYTTTATISTTPIAECPWVDCVYCRQELVEEQ